MQTLTRLGEQDLLQTAHHGFVCDPLKAQISQDLLHPALVIVVAADPLNASRPQELVHPALHAVLAAERLNPQSPQDLYLYLSLSLMA